MVLLQERIRKCTLGSIKWRPTSKHTFLRYSMKNLFVRFAHFDETSWLANGGHIAISCVVACSIYDFLSHIR